MAIRKIGSRRIVVDGASYRWRIRHRATYSQMDYGTGTIDLSVESADSKGAVLVLLTDRPHPKDCIPRPLDPVKPSDVAGWIRLAMQAGWAPTRPGPQVHLRVRGTAVEPLA